MKTSIISMRITVAYVVIALVGCAKATTPDLSISIVTPSIEAVSSPTAAAESLPTPTPFTSELETECVSFGDASGQSVDGDIIVAIHNSTQPVLIERSTEHTIYLEGTVFFTAAVSPDQTGLAYIDTDQHNVIIVNARGEIQKTMSGSRNWRRVLLWLDDENLLIENFRPQNAGSLVPSSAIVLDISTGDYKEYIPDYPDILPSYLYYSLHWGQYSTLLTVYSTDLSRVVYPSQSESQLPIIFWDIPNQREVTRIYTGGQWGSTPQWNPARKYFLVSALPRYADTNGTPFVNGNDNYSYVGGTELFSVGEAGNVQQLTYLTLEQEAKEEAFSISPNGNLIAFWLTFVNTGIQKELVILDVPTGQITKLCLRTENVSPTLPIWSSSGKQIAVSIQNSADMANIIIIDVEKFTAKKIESKAIPIGWMIKP